MQNVLVILDSELEGISPNVALYQVGLNYLSGSNMSNEDENAKSLWEHKCTKQKKNDNGLILIRNAS